MRRKRPLTRRERALSWLAAAVGLALLIHLLSGSQLLPSGVKSLAEDEYATGPTQVVAQVERYEREGERLWYKTYLAAGDKALLLYETRLEPWRLGWVLTDAEVVDLTEEKELFIGTEVHLLELGQNQTTYWRRCFGRTDRTEAAQFVLKSGEVRLLEGEEEARIREDTARELARFGTERCYYRDGHAYFDYDFEYTVDREEPGRAVWLEVYDAAGELLCRERAGLL